METNTYKEYTGELTDSLGTSFSVSIFYYATPTGVSIEEYTFDEATVSREDLVERFGEDAVAGLEQELED